jgi:hypothetical protein
MDISHLGPMQAKSAIDYSPVRRYSSRQKGCSKFKIPIHATAASVAGCCSSSSPPRIGLMLFANESRAGRTLVLFLLAPALIGIVTGSCVSAASTVVERWALGQLAALPGLLPIVGPPLALVVTLGVVVYVTVAAASGAASVRVWQLTSWGRGPRGGRPPPEGASVGYPPGDSRSRWNRATCRGWCGRPCTTTTARTR